MSGHASAEAIPLLERLTGIVVIRSKKICHWRMLGLHGCLTLQIEVALGQSIRMVFGEAVFRHLFAKIIVLWHKPDCIWSCI